MNAYKPITAEWLRENGYDGFVQPGECGCRIVDGLRPCGETPLNEDDECEPAHEVACTRCGNGNCMPLTDDPTDQWCMRGGKREEATPND